MPLQSKRMPPQPRQNNQNDTSGCMSQPARNNAKPLARGITPDHKDIDSEILANAEEPRNSTLTYATTNEATGSHNDSTPQFLGTMQAKEPSASLPAAGDTVAGTYQYRFGHFDGFERAQPRTPIPPPHLFRYRQREILSTPYHPPRPPARNITRASQRLPFDTPAVLRGSSAFNSSAGDRVLGLEDPFVDTRVGYQFPGINYVPWNRR